jgi:hypothetical protein
VWSALGFGPVTPGAPFYVVGSPLFERAEIELLARPAREAEGGRDRAFVVEAPGASLTGKYVQSASLGGRPLERAWFLHDAIDVGKTLRLEMGDAPDRVGLDARRRAPRPGRRPAVGLRLPPRLNGAACRPRICAPRTDPSPRRAPAPPICAPRTDPRWRGHGVAGVTCDEAAPAGADAASCSSARRP